MSASASKAVGVGLWSHFEFKPHLRVPNMLDMQVSGVVLTLLGLGLFFFIFSYYFSLWNELSILG